jgi:hypothetical protein
MWKNYWVLFCSQVQTGSLLEGRKSISDELYGWHHEYRAICLESLKEMLK